MAIPIIGNIDPTDKFNEFAQRGFAARRINPDGTACTPARNFARAGNVDLTVPNGDGRTLLDTGGTKAALIISADGPGVDIQKRLLLDFSGAANLRGVTPAEAVVAFNAAIAAAGLTAGFTAELNTEGGVQRCNLRCKNPDAEIVQIYGWLAGALGFGGHRAWRGITGTAFCDYISGDDVITSAPAVQRSDDTNADLSGGGLNTLSRVTVPGKETGTQYTVNTKAKDYTFRAMIEGGKLNTASDKHIVRYERPRAGEDTGDCAFEMYEVVPQYGANETNNINDFEAVELNHVFKMTGRVQDDSRSANGLSSFNYLFDCGVSYTDEEGIGHSQPEPRVITKEQWGQNVLMRAITRNFKERDLYTYPLTGISFVPATTLVKNQNGTVNAMIQPSYASGYTIAFSAPSVITGTTFQWDAANKRVMVNAGAAAGTEVITATVTNEDGTTVTGTFSITVV